MLCEPFYYYEVKMEYEQKEVKMNDVIEFMNGLKE